MGPRRHGLHKQGWQRIVTSSALLRLKRRIAACNTSFVTSTTALPRTSTQRDRAAWREARIMMLVEPNLRRQGSVWPSNLGDSQTSCLFLRPP